MADRGGFLREGVITYAYILLYIASPFPVVRSSSTRISPFLLFWVFTAFSLGRFAVGFVVKGDKLSLSLGLTLFHVVFSSTLCFLLTKVLKIMKVDEGMTVDIYFTPVIPIGAMFAVTLWLGNTEYLYISVAFAQMLKAIRTTGLATWAVTLLGILA